MDTIGSMNSLRDDAATTTRLGKNANARRANDQENASAFGELLAGLSVPNVVPVQPPIQQETPQMSEAQVSEATSHHATQAGEMPAANQLAAANTVVNTATDTAVGSGQNIATPTDDASTPTASAVSSQALAQLSGVGIDDQAPTLQLAQTASAVPAINKIAPPSITTNAATLSASRSNAGVAAALQNDAEPSTPATGTSPTTGSTAANSPVLSNDNAALMTQAKAKTVEVDLAVKTPSQPLEPVSTTLDGAGSTSVISGQEVAVPANDQANRAPQLTPQTIPMLAATMMRRLDSGSKQFTMRLDPPELGQVEVKLTVAADKKVRAVVSADRPEALADLVRSARELVRALSEAGLDLEDNGLTFQMNDPSAGGQHQETSDRQPTRAASIDVHVSDNVKAETPVTSNKIQTPSDPFERWQRARIALTA